MNNPITISNDQFVGIRGDGMVVIAMPKAVMTRTEAIRHAAWLIALADDAEDFSSVLDAINRT